MGTYGRRPDCQVAREASVSTGTCEQHKGPSSSRKVSQDNFCQRPLSLHLSRHHATSQDTRSDLLLLLWRGCCSRLVIQCAVFTELLHKGQMRLEESKALRDLHLYVCGCTCFSRCAHGEAVGPLKSPGMTGASWVEASACKRLCGFQYKTINQMPTDVKGSDKIGPPDIIGQK
eukprot:4315945-Amphidinium_carterae.1